MSLVVGMQSIFNQLLGMKMCKKVKKSRKNKTAFCFSNVFQSYTYIGLKGKWKNSTVQSFVYTHSLSLSDTHTHTHTHTLEATFSYILSSWHKMQNTKVLFSIIWKLFWQSKKSFSECFQCVFICFTITSLFSRSC
jgi:hypothetical protein